MTTVLREIDIPPLWTLLQLNFFIFFYKNFDILERVGHHLDHVIALAIIFGRTTSPLHNLLTALYNIWSHIFFHSYGPYNTPKRKRKDDYQNFFNILNMTDISRIEIFDVEVGGSLGENVLFFHFLLFFLFLFTLFIFLLNFSFIIAIGEFYHMLT